MTSRFASTTEPMVQLAKVDMLDPNSNREPGAPPRRRFQAPDVNWPLAPTVLLDVSHADAETRQWIIRVAALLLSTAEGARILRSLGGVQGRGARIVVEPHQHGSSLGARYTAITREPASGGEMGVALELDDEGEWLFEDGPVAEHRILMRRHDLNSFDSREEARFKLLLDAVTLLHELHHVRYSERGNPLRVDFLGHSAEAKNWTIDRRLLMLKYSPIDARVDPEFLNSMNRFALQAGAILGFRPRR